MICFLLAGVLYIWDWALEVAREWMEVLNDNF